MNEKSQILVFTTSPFQLLCQIAYIKQSNLSHIPTIVFHYATYNENILHSERWICDVYGIHFSGYLGNIVEDMGQILQGNKLLKLFKSLFFIRKWHHWGSKKLKTLHQGKNTHVITGFRPHLEDILILNFFPKASFHFIADGILAGFNSFIDLPKTWKLARIKNYYSKNSNNIIWLLSGLEKAMGHFGNVKLIKQDSFLDVKHKLFQEKKLLNWIDSIIKNKIQQSTSCLLLQPLAKFNWLDPYEEILFYSKIIHYELNSTENFIIIKPHPRDCVAKIELLKNTINKIYLDRVYFLQQDNFSSMPIEILAEIFKINKLIGLCSTAIITTPKIVNLSVHLYTSKTLPEKLQTEIMKIAKLESFPIIEI